MEKNLLEHRIIKWFMKLKPLKPEHINWLQYQSNVDLNDPSDINILTAIKKLDLEEQSAFYNRFIKSSTR